MPVACHLCGAWVDALIGGNRGRLVGMVAMIGRI